MRLRLKYEDLGFVKIDQGFISFDFRKAGNVEVSITSQMPEGFFEYR